jgi:hypothetical protein
MGWWWWQNGFLLNRSATMAYELLLMFFVCVQHYQGGRITFGCCCALKILFTSRVELPPLLLLPKFAISDDGFSGSQKSFNNASLDPLNSGRGNFLNVWLILSIAINNVFTTTTFHVKKSLPAADQDDIWAYKSYYYSFSSAAAVMGRKSSIVHSLYCPPGLVTVMVFMKLLFPGYPPKAVGNKRRNTTHRI